MIEIRKNCFDKNKIISYFGKFRKQFGKNILKTAADQSILNFY